jgi:hypothetical protein
MAQTYSMVREQCVEGVIRNSTNPPPLDRIRAIFDASFFAINSQTSEAFAARNDKRELLRVVETLTFTAGSASVPTDTLKKFIADATLTVGTTIYGFRKYNDYIRGHDPRLGAWTQIGESLLANKPQNAGVLTGSANFSSIQSPAVPATESADFDAPEDYYPDFIAAMTGYILGQTMDVAAETA